MAERKWNSNELMEHLKVEKSTETASSSKSCSDSDMDLRPDSPQPTLQETASPKLTPARKEASPSKADRPRKIPSQLHEELAEFSRMLQMDEKEIRRKKQIIEIITESSQKLFKYKHPRLEVQAFGGFKNGLATKMSDIDIVISGIYSPDDYQNSGFSLAVKSQVCRCLQQLSHSLRLPHKKEQLISKARIPLLKLTTNDGIDVDVSLGNDSGPRAARFIRSKVEEFPAARPLVLVLKYILQSNSLNDVATSGLGTYSLANMVIAFLTDRKERKKDMKDYGILFLDFLHFFGFDFYYKKTAVSLRNGTFCSKKEVLNRDARSREDDYLAFKICIEDYFTGNDVSGGTLKMQQIVRLFRSAYDTLNPFRNDNPRDYNRRQGLFPVLSKLSWLQCSFDFGGSSDRRTRASSSRGSSPKSKSFLIHSSSRCVTSRKKKNGRKQYDEISSSRRKYSKRRDYQGRNELRRTASCPTNSE